MLFLPNTCFEVTSTLFSDSAIGAFYSSSDNVEMSEILQQNHLSLAHHLSMTSPRSARSAGAGSMHGVLLVHCMPCSKAGLHYSEPTTQSPPPPPSLRTEFRSSWSLHTCGRKALSRSLQVQGQSTYHMEV